MNERTYTYDIGLKGMENDEPPAFDRQNGPWFLPGTLETVLITPRRPWIGRWGSDDLIEFVRWCDEA